MEDKYYKIQNCSVAQVIGKDSIDYLQRISTNDFTILENKKYITTCFLNDKGRLIDICNIYKLNENLYLSSSSSNFSKTIEHLNKYIITDDVEIIIDTRTYKQVITYNSKLIENELVGFDEKIQCLIYLMETDKIKKYFDSKDELASDEFNYQSIMNGIIKVNEYTFENYNPLELNLKDYISFTKGCYLGQEIIARLDTYNKTSKHLVVLKNNDVNRNFIDSELQNINKQICGKIIDSQMFEGIVYYLAIISNRINDTELYSTGLNTNFLKVKDFNIN